MGAAHSASLRPGARVWALPPEARAQIDQMLSQPGCTYEAVAAALDAHGLVLSKGDIGRYEAANNDDRREAGELARQLRQLDRWMKKHSGSETAAAALSLMMGRLYNRIVDQPDLFDELPPDKAAASLISASRAAIQCAKAADDAKKNRDAARAEILSQLKSALRERPDLWAQISALVADAAG
jgi:hypothetical protein